MTFNEFAETKKFKTIMNYIYSWGAAVVIAGALFKILHWPGANIALIAGMGTEVLVFFVFGIDPTQVHMELDWSLVYPELAGMAEEEEKKKDKKSVTEQLDNMLEEAKIGPELINSLSSGLQNLSASTIKLGNIADTSIAANGLSDSMKSATQKVSGFTEAYDKAGQMVQGSVQELEKSSNKAANLISGSADELSKSYNKASQSLEQLSISTQQGTGTYTEQLQKASKNLGSLNNAYESQLQNSNENIKSVSKTNEGIQNLLSKLESSLQASHRDSVSYSDNLKKTTNNIESLNSAYELQLNSANENIKITSKANEGIQTLLSTLESSLHTTQDDAVSYSDNLKKTTNNIESLNSAYESQLHSVNENIKITSKANEGIQTLLSTLESSLHTSKDDAVSYGNNLKKTTNNIESLNSAYELQLQLTKEHIGKTNKLYEGVERTMASLNESSEDAKKFKQGIAAMSENLTALNIVYGNMLTAMNIGKK
ncbi:MAG: gliding motility protein GldL [Bacteroidota bacterium]